MPTEVAANAALARLGPVWLGLSDRGDEGVFRTVLDTGPTFLAWARGEPDDGGGAEDCAAIGRPRDGAWFDGACDSARPVACEVP